MKKVNKDIDCKNSIYENNYYDNYDDNSDSCCTSDVADNNNNAFDGVDNSVTMTAKHYDDQFALLNLQKGIGIKKSLCQILNNDDSLLDWSYDSIRKNETVHNIHINHSEARTVVPDRCTYASWKKLRQLSHQHETQNEFKKEILVCQ